MAPARHSADEREDGAGSPAPPPPPPPPPPQDDVGDSPLPSSSKPPAQPMGSSSSGAGDKPRRVDYRELFALFHAEDEDPTESKEKWDHLWRLSLAEAREEFRVQQLERKRQKKRGGGGTDSDSTATGLTAPTPTRGATGMARGVPSGTTGSSGTGLSSADKRPRPPAPSDADANKAMRLNRAPPPANRPKPSASKLMQKLGSRGS